MSDDVAKKFLKISPSSDGKTCRLKVLYPHHHVDLEVSITHDRVVLNYWFDPGKDPSKWRRTLGEFHDLASREPRKLPYHLRDEFEMVREAMAFINRWLQNQS